MSDEETMRLDRLLVFLRFARTRSASRAMIESGNMRLNGARVAKVACEVAVGDVLTFARGNEVCVARVERLPARRLSSAEASRAWTALT